MVLRFYYRYIMFVIIQHLCIGKESHEITAPVHNAMYKKISSTLPKSTKNIQIVNKISLPHYYNIFGHSFGFWILPYSYHHNMNQNFYLTRKNIERRSFCSRIRYHIFWKLCSIRSSKLWYFRVNSRNFFIYLATLLHTNIQCF